MVIGRLVDLPEKFGQGLLRVCRLSRRVVRCPCRLHICSWRGGGGGGRGGVSTPAAAAANAQIR